MLWNACATPLSSTSYVKRPTDLLELRYKIEPVYNFKGWNFSSSLTPLRWRWESASWQVHNHRWLGALCDGRSLKPTDLMTNWLTKDQSNSMEQRPFWDINTPSRTKKKFQRFISADFRYRIHKISALVPITSHPIPWRPNWISSSNLRLRFPRALTKNLCTPLHSPIRNHAPYIPLFLTWLPE